LAKLFKFATKPKKFGHVFHIKGTILNLTNDALGHTLGDFFNKKYPVTLPARQKPQ
jgi:hypothetical protein